MDLWREATLLYLNTFIIMCLFISSNARQIPSWKACMVLLSYLSTRASSVTVIELYILGLTSLQAWVA